jgi:hypothetical protein
MTHLFVPQIPFGSLLARFKSLLLSRVLMTVYENRPVLVSGTMNALHLRDGNKNKGAAVKH